MKKNPSTPRNWENLCHQRKNAVNNWTIIDRQPFEYEAVCNVSGREITECQPCLAVKRLCFSFCAYYGMLCAHFTRGYRVDSRVSGVICFHYFAHQTHNEKGAGREVLEHWLPPASKFKYTFNLFLTDSSTCSSPPDSWHAAQSKYSLLADKLLWPLASSNDIILISSREIPDGHSQGGDTLNHLAACNLADSHLPPEVTHGKPLIVPADGISQRVGLLWNTGTGDQEIWATLEAMGHLCLQHPQWFVPRMMRLSWAHIVSRNRYLSTSSTLLLRAISLARQIALPRVTELQDWGKCSRASSRTKKEKIKVNNLVVISWLVAQIFTCSFAQSV